jgi:hypothetical protein
MTSWDGSGTFAGGDGRATRDEQAGSVKRRITAMS